MKITMKLAGENLPIKGAVEDFMVAQMAKGVSDKTVEIHAHFHSISRHLEKALTFGELTQADLDRMVGSMRRSGLADNSISSYLHLFRTFMK